MIFFLTLLQIFIPYKEQNLLELPEINKTTLDKLVQSNKTIIAFSVEKAYKEMVPVIRSMNEGASIFGEYATFVYLERSLAQEIAYINRMSLPSFFFFREGKLISSHAYPQNDSTFVKILQGLLHPLQIGTKDDLFSYLGDCYYSILSLPELFNDSIEVFHKHQIECDIVFVTKELLNDLDLDDTRLALYRREDNVIVSFSNFSIAGIPYYTVLNYRFMVNEKRPTFGIVAPEFTAEMKDLFYELSDLFPDFTFGYICKEYLAYFQTTLGVQFNNTLLNASIFHPIQRYHLNISSIFTPDVFNKPFNYGEWLELAKAALTKARNNEFTRLYLSEPVPSPVLNAGPIQKVVGITYNEFVNQPGKDVLILLMRPFGELNAHMNNTMYELHRITQNASMTNMSFGIIDVTSNAANFPYFYMIPQLFIYPANNKTNPVPLRGNLGMDNIFWFINRYGTYECPVGYTMISHGQFEMDLKQILGQFKDMPQQERENFFEWAYELAYATNTDLSKYPQIPEKYYPPSYFDRLEREHEGCDHDHEHQHEHEHEHDHSHHHHEQEKDYNEL
ncbi:hypothetical protein TRFO_01113 [Tritrichomonas foetus]|uniref:Thioredoxin domain-containing protein n=1 Tax=Tritrichomonas foetus TaxID=1144522 RepID=A0A1J4KJC6_9EUKA|nr:hypothetical protein TRFO_01113 [Tritrichomonas foetus]|eukprot:OHT11186.1 hypothetical protein TRFO_01113 [Tritrichomonas foetus]